MKIQKRNNISKRFRNILMFVAVCGAVGSGIGTSFVASALTNSSPERESVSTGSFNGGVSHLLKKETVAKVRLQAAIYYPTSSGGNTNGDKLSIRYGHNNPSKKCFIGKTGGNIVVEFKTNGSTLSYKVPIKNACKNRINQNAKPGNPSNNNNQFFANFPLPATMGKEGRTNKYKINFNIYFDDGVSVGASQHRTVNFVPEIWNKNGGENKGANGPKIGLLATDAANTGNAFGLRSARTTPLTGGPGSNSMSTTPDRLDVRVASDFAVPCDSSDTEFPVRLYDPDVGVFGDTFMWVTERRWNAGKKGWETIRLPLSRYNNSKKSTAKWVDSKKAYQSTGESNITSLITVKNAKKTYNGKRVSYEFHVVNKVTDNKTSPVNNVLSVGIPYDSVYADLNCEYAFTPSTSLPAGQDTYRYYPNLNVTGIIEKQGGVVPEDHPWEMYVVKYTNAPSTTSVSGDAAGLIGGCERVPYANQIAGSCLRIHNAATRGSTEKQINYNEGGPDTPGTRTCFFTRIKDPTDDDTPPSENHWRYSDMVCAKSGIKPKLQVWGGDLQVGGTIKTSLTRNKNDMKLFGAWAEYGVFANGTNTNMASGSGLLGGTTDSAPDRNMLTFSNDGTFGNFGGLTPPSFQGTVESLSYDATNTCSIGPNEFGRDTKKVYYCDGTLVIGGDQRYVGTYSNINQIPNVKLVARDVVVEANVSQIDTGIVALNVKKDANDEASKVNNNRGRLSTCGAVNRIQSGNKQYFLEPDQVRINNAATAGLRLGPCNTQLTFNGPISVNQLFAYRTNEASLGTPAEIFNLRADNFLSAYGGRDSSETPVARTVNITELPPRF